MKSIRSKIQEIHNKVEDGVGFQNTQEPITWRELIFCDGLLSVLHWKVQSDCIVA